MQNDSKSQIDTKISLKSFQNLLHITAEEAEDARRTLRSNEKKSFLKKFESVVLHLLSVRSTISSLQNTHSVGCWDFLLDSIENVISTLTESLYKISSDVLLIDIASECYLISEENPNLSLGKLLSLDIDVGDHGWTFSGPFESIIDTNMNLREEFEIAIQQFIFEGKLPTDFLEKLEICLNLSKTVI